MSNASGGAPSGSARWGGGEGPQPPGRSEKWVVRNFAPICAFVVAGVVLALVTGPDRLRQRSKDPHFVVQAAAWIDGRLDIQRWPSGADDPAKVEVVTTKQGESLRGRRINSRGVFRAFGGKEIALSELAPGKQTMVHYMSFPPVPSVILLPQVILDGERANDVRTTVFLAALIPALFLVLLRRLRELGLSSRTIGDEIWLTVLLCFGTVLFFSSVQGRVWFTAHVIGVLLAILYAWSSIEARHPVLAGLFLALAVGTRPPMLFLFPLFVLEAWRASNRDWRAFVRRGALFAVPMVIVGAALAWHNYVRFGEFAEFGHSYLAVKQQVQIEQYGLFNIHYLIRNLAIAFTLMPGFVSSAPYVSISGHGLAIWITTPALLLLAVWARDRHPLRLGLWLGVLLVAAWSLAYQNSGWLQFGYRFALDYIVFLVLLLALARRRIGWFARSLIILGVVVNLFGALTFDRLHRAYRSGDEDYARPGPPFLVRH